MVERPVVDITVVIIVCNDVTRLPVAARSALCQTLRSVELVIVDDCSQDGSYDVALDISSRYPGRVRVFRLSENSGSGGEPRNVGIAKAAGQYVMFLDSDDVLEPNACRNLLEAALHTGADMVSGLCVRIVVDSRRGETDKWCEWLYRRTRVLESVTELPDLFAFDTLSTNKIYRLDFLTGNNLRFPKGLLYEDLLFTAEAYLAARRITLIPNEIYHWRVYQHAKDKSVTNRRHEMKNFTDRIEIHRRIDKILRSRGHDELRLAKDIKFLKHDLVLHLRDIPFRSTEFRREFSETARSYLKEINESAYEAVQPIQAICAYLLVKDDWPNLLRSVDTLINRHKLSSPLSEQDGSVYWCADHLDDPLGRKILDVTELGYHVKDIDDLSLRNELLSYSQSSSCAHLAGRIINPLRTITPRAKLSGEIQFRARRISLQTFSFPLTRLRHDGDGIQWEATVNLAKRLRPLGAVDAIWDVRLTLSVDGKKTTTRITAGDVPLSTATRLRARPRLTRLVSDTWEPLVSSRGHLAFQLTSRGIISRSSRKAASWAFKGPSGAVARTGVRKAKHLRRRALSQNARVRAYHELFCKLPVRKGMVVFESHLGKQYSDSPRAIYEELCRQGVKFTPVWSYAKHPGDFPKEAQLVKRWSWQYLRALAQAEYWIDNQGYPGALQKRPGTTYIQTWHGSALKKMGFDSPEWRLKSQVQQEECQKGLDRFDHFLVRSPHDIRTLVAAFRIPESKIIRSGYPRNDVLVAARKAELGGRSLTLGKLARELGIPEGRHVLLYAPTFRSGPRGEVRPFEPPFSFTDFTERFGDRYVLLVRAHYLNTVVIPPAARASIIDVTHVHDAAQLYLLTDALITDYSSAMFDYALLDRPMVFFAYDLDEYTKDIRGTYFDLSRHAPGPVIREEQDLFEILNDLDKVKEEWASSRREFAQEFGEYDCGDAAKQVVEMFFRPGGSA
ncbi:bifunctional glycosyltransferase/CDP-glycerol:glycerophosphate glycerophosphotransferase [Streptomyces klenkii]|uniref:bifunctional glycosyltransferase/CDP-glycerol:glycerophosphate glycerophosphotransferase n=1 Tax=Streptomyces klenkii TaxID=1420899 RepID=UPI00343CF9E5